MTGRESPLSMCNNSGGEEGHGKTLVTIVGYGAAEEDSV